MADGVYHGALISKTPIKSDIPANDFPTMQKIGEKISSHSLSVDGITWVSAAMSYEETRYYLNGICFSGKDIVATDGHRLHKIETGERFNHPKFPQGAIVPKEAIKYALLLAKEKKTDVMTFTMHEHMALFEIGDTKLWTKYIDATFPDYYMVIPNNSTLALCKFNASDFARAEKRYKELEKVYGKKKDSSRSIKISDGKPLLLIGDNPESFDANFSLPTTIGFNVTYLKESGLESADFYYGDSCSPVKIVQGNKMAIVMPLRA